MLLSYGRLIGIAMLLMLSACAAFNPAYEEPDVSISAFRALPSNGLPEFEIELQITNPNNFALKLRGISYSASIEGHRLITGVANNIPEIAAYGKGSVTLNSRPDLLGGVKLLADLMQARSKSINYQLQVKLDLGQFMPNIYVEREGVIAAPAK